MHIYIYVYIYILSFLLLQILAAEVSCDGYPDVIESVAEDGDMKDRVRCPHGVANNKTANE